MTTEKRKRCRWASLAASVSLACSTLLIAWAAPVAAQGIRAGRVSAAAPAGLDSLPDQSLYLEIILNHLPLRRIVHFVAHGGRLYAEADALKGLGLTWPGASSATGLVALDSLPGLHADYDEADQQLSLMAPMELLGGSPAVLGYTAPPAPKLDPATRTPGLLLNYDVYAQTYQGQRTVSGWSELRMFGAGPGVWRSSGLTQSTSGGIGENRFRNTRLDTSWQMDFPKSMISVTLGDSFSGSLSWTRSMRFGGLRVSRNFDLQPYRVTVPLASFIGQTALPSVVDLYINGIRESRNNVSPGQFELVNAPTINGAGTAQMVITDVTGQRRVVDFSLYNSARMLQKGLADWSFEVGALRRSYGLESFSYAKSPMFSASGRYGLNNYLTLESHGENSDGLTMGGVGALLRLGTGGIFRASYAASNYEAQRGKQYGLGYEWQGSRFSISLSTQRSDDTFRDIGTLEGSTLPTRSSQAFAGVNTHYGQFGASYVQQKFQDGYRSKYVGLNWSRSLGRYGYINVGANRDLEGDGGTNVYVYWSLPLGDNHQAWASTRNQGQGSTTSVGAMRALPGDSDGFGWRVQASQGADAGGQAEVSELTRYGQWRAGAQYWNGQGNGSSNMAYAGASGGLLLMKGSVFPMRRVSDAFALVSTDGIPGVPVKLENRTVGTTDSDGLLLVTPLNAWQNNNLSIDPLVLPADVAVDHVRMTAVPATGSGMLARFPMKEVLTVELSVRKEGGGWVPAGSTATLMPGGQHVTVGYDGRMYLEGPPAGGQLTIRLATGACRVGLPADMPGRGRINLGERTCR